MMNELLHRLTNRTGPFSQDLFLADPSFTPKKEGSEERQFRKALMLDHTESDYYIKAYLSTISAYPDLAVQFDRNNQSYDLTDIEPRGVQIEGGDFYSRPPGVSGRFLDTPPDGLPIPLHYQVLYWDDSNVRIRQLDRQQQSIAGYTLSKEEPHQVMQCQWPDTMPFEGPIHLHQSWMSNALIDIWVEPSQFPYQEVITQLRRHRFLTTLLIRHNMVDAFYGSPEAEEQLAIVLTLLALENS